MFDVCHEFKILNNVYTLGQFLNLTHSVNSLRVTYKVFYQFIASTHNDKCMIIMATLVCLSCNSS